MTNKIVQLTDDDGNNLYPVTNGPQITMTETDPGEGVPLAENHYIGVYGGDPIIMDYSTNEVNTGAKWIDGSTIYKKTINFGNLGNATTKTVSHGITGLAQLIKKEGLVKNANGIYLSLDSPSTASTTPLGYIRTIVDSTSISINTDIDRTNDTAYVTLYYTKSS